jgi:hypothetical protein
VLLRVESCDSATRWTSSSPASPSRSRATRLSPGASPATRLSVAMSTGCSGVCRHTGASWPRWRWLWSPWRWERPCRCPAADRTIRAQTAERCGPRRDDRRTGDVHKDYKSLQGVKPQAIGQPQTVRVSCRVRGVKVGPSSNPWWYLIVAPTQFRGSYITADAFYNN